VQQRQLLWVSEKSFQAGLSAMVFFSFGFLGMSFEQSLLSFLQVLAMIQEFGEKNVHQLPPYDVRTHEGFLKHLTIRSGRDCNTGELQLMVNFVTKDDKPELLQPLVDHISASFPQLVSIVNNVNTSIGPSSVGEKEHVLHGVGFITEHLRGLVFEISANSFFQTNTDQAEVLYQCVEEQCKLKGDSSEIVLDLFCGTGSIGLSIASRYPLSNRNSNGFNFL
jgi:tRNA/tmRNA/rRNA uracil-C5-methylase (TrmA/RlmC/RlmD family)